MRFKINAGVNVRSEHVFHTANRILKIPAFFVRRSWSNSAFIDLTIC